MGAGIMKKEPLALRSTASDFGPKKVSELERVFLMAAKFLIVILQK